MAVTVGDVVVAMERKFPPETAEPWDRVGLTVGDPDAPCSRIGFAIDPCEATISEAIGEKADLLITHHPLYLRGTHTVVTTDAKGRWTTRMIKAGLAQFSAHTNADVAASTGALADLLGVRVNQPLDTDSGIGGVGTLEEPVTLAEFAARVSDVLPKVYAGILVGGDMDRIISTVAICSGSGDSLLNAANKAGADVYLTADLRHHPATDHLWDGGCALVCATHWASEWPVLGAMERLLSEELGGAVSTYISTIPTDPWVARL